MDRIRNVFSDNHQNFDLNSKPSKQNDVFKED